VATLKVFAQRLPKTVSPGPWWRVFPTHTAVCCQQISNTDQYGLYTHKIYNIHVLRIGANTVYILNYTVALGFKHPRIYSFVRETYHEYAIIWVNTPPFSRRREHFSKFDSVVTNYIAVPHRTNWADFWVASLTKSVFSTDGFSVPSLVAGKLFVLDFHIQHGFIQSPHKLAIFKCP
jgi:hypothetical protein